ncbi:MAG: hypothetical protein ACRER1_05335 [Gammaproteobacteria bacterium]
MSARPFLVALLLLASATFAGPAIAQTAAPAGIYPTRGMSMAEVRQQFGAPQRRLPPDPATAQGPLKPPIVRWVYPRFTVYFERGRVIHSVLTHPRRAPAANSSAGG